VNFMPAESASQPPYDDEPLVTIAIPTYNGRAHIRDAIASATAQTYARVEILIVDDCSTDDTLNISRTFASHRANVILRAGSQNIGLAGNFNRCLRAGSGSWVKFLLQDDLLDQRCVEDMVAARRETCPLIICGRRYRYELAGDVRRAVYDNILGLALTRRTNRLELWDPPTVLDQVFKDLGTNVFGEPVSWLVKRDAALAVGGFSLHLRAILDYEFSLRLALLSGIVVLPTELCTFRVHPGQESAKQMSSFDVATLDPAILLTLLASDPAYESARRAAVPGHTATELRREAVRRIAHAWAYSRSLGEPATARWDEIFVESAFVRENVSQFDLCRAALRLRAGRIARRLHLDPDTVRPR